MPEVKSSNLQYVVAVLLISGLGVVAVVAVVMLRPNEDNTVLIATIIGFLLPTMTALLAFMKSQETHLSVNSRLDAWMAEAKKSARAEGVTEGLETGQNRAAKVIAAVRMKKTKVDILGEDDSTQVEGTIDGTIVIKPKDSEQ